MMDVDALLHEYGIRLPSTAPNRYYLPCPKCSAGRKGAHRNAKVLGVTIEPNGGIHFGCNHCGWTGPEKGNGKIHGHASADNVITYDYLDEAGELLFQKVRGPNKKFWQRKPDGRGGWDTKLGKTRKVIYRLPEVIEAIAAGYFVAVVEGEKDANNLWRLGIPATCNPDGASEPGKKPKWRPEYSELLRDADVVIMGDNDAAGRAHVEATASTSKGIAARIRVVDPKHFHVPPKRNGDKPGKDVSDWLAAGHTREELDALIDQAPVYEPVRSNGPPPAEIARLADDSLARRYADRHVDELRYVALWGRWQEWKGSHWATDEKLRTMSLARELCRDIAREEEDL